ncbi:F-box/kelch-repeat protein At3g23880-like [Bidens hawaiensis]|uniref:F-box/kelch-repeat protein At3g23880-like n=1 Tax=Bidens hawaiensis TaxID=980011 RepID=UPI0040499914
MVEVFSVADDILEQILLKLDVEDLIRCKSVCKSWLTLISHRRFIKNQLNYSYNTDRHNNKYGHRRIALVVSLFGFTFIDHYGPFCYIIGSSNGLVCNCYSNAEIIVINPCTGVHRKLPQLPGYTPSSFWPLCCGFGYDSSSDDYKVVAGMRKSEYVTCFFMLTLKSNVWKVFADVKYMFNSRNGVLCNGALHWVMFAQTHNTSNGDGNNKMNKKAVILSFDLSQHIFKEIPQPDDDPLYQSLGVGVPKRYWRYMTDMSLGIMGECLCIFPFTSIPSHIIWVMNKYNVKESWGIVGPHDCEILECQSMHLMTTLELSSPSRVDLFTIFGRRMCRNCEFIGTPVFVRSLVSPHDPFLNS